MTRGEALTQQRNKALKDAAARAFMACQSCLGTGWSSAIVRGDTHNALCAECKGGGVSPYSSILPVPCDFCNQWGEPMDENGQRLNNRYYLNLCPKCEGLGRVFPRRD